MSPVKAPHFRWQHYFSVLLLGVVLRLLYPTDTVWLDDQWWTLSHAVQGRVTHSWPWLGMMSSGGVPNPGFSLWIFIPFVLAGLTTPLQLSEAVVGMNVLALVLLGLWAILQLDEDREQWLWAGAFVAANPVYVYLSRVVWPPAIAPPLVVGLWISYWNREKRWGSFLWGMLGLVIAQIHMVGFFIVTALFIGAFLDRRKHTPRWTYYFAGVCSTAWTLIPWIREVLASASSRPKWGWWAHFPGKVWTWWLATDGGLGVKYLDTNFWHTSLQPFIAQPRIMGIPTFGVLIALIGLIALLVVPVAIVGIRMWQNHAQEGWMPSFLRGDSKTAQLLRTMVLIFGTLLSLLPAPVFVHYYMVLIPIGGLWIARMWFHASERYARGALWLMLILLLFVSFTAAPFVHQANPPGFLRRLQ